MTKNNKEGVFGRTEIHMHTLEKSGDKKEHSPYISTFLGVGLAAVVFFMLLSACIGVTSATDYYVSLSGSDGNSGLTEATAWRHIYYAATRAQAGDTVHIKGGNYGHEHVVMQYSGTSGNYITFEGYDGEVKIDGQDGGGYGINLNSKSYIAIDGITITRYFIGVLGVGTSVHHINLYNITAYNNKYGGSGHNIDLEGTEDNGPHDCVIKNCELWNADMANLMLRGVNNILVEDCLSYNTVTSGYADYAYLIKDGGKNCIIKNCTAGQFGTNAGMHHAFAIRYGSHHNKIIDCTAYGTSHGKMSQYIAALDDAHHNEFINCKVIKRSETNIRAYGYAISGTYNSVINCAAIGVKYGINIGKMGDVPPTPLGHIIKNNIAIDNVYGIIHLDGGSDISISYNDVWGNTNNYYGTSPGTGDISEDPLFVDKGNGNIHLKSEYGRWDGSKWVYDSVTSPCIDAGDPSDDHGKEPLPNGDRINRGAYGNTEEASKSPGAATGIISGTVKDESSGNPVEGATVTDDSYSNTTSSTGYYIIPNVPVGTSYTVTVSKTGYQNQSRKNVEVLEDQTTEVNFTLTEGTDLVAEWHFDEGSGIIAEDTSGNNNNGTLTNMDPATDWVDGKPGKALDFDGSNDYVDCGNVLNFERTDPFSIMAWVKTTDTVGNIAGNSHSSSPYTGYSLVIDGSQLRVHLINDYVAGKRIEVDEAASGTVNDGNWHHVGMTYTGSSSAAGIKLFIDGQEIGTTTVADNLRATIISPVSLTIGKKPDGNYEYPLDGTIDEVKIYNRALNAEEIKADYVAGLEDITLPETTITSGPDGTINNSVISFSWTGSDDVTPTSQLLYSYKLEGYGDSWSSWTSVTTKSFNGLANYDYTFKVKAKDEAGNEDPTPAEWSFTVDIPVTVPRYDVNADGKVDDLDITIVAQHNGETTNPPYPRYDVNANGKVNAWDTKIEEQHFGEITN